MICGERLNGNFSVYSLREQRYLLELSLGRYRRVNLQEKIVRTTEGWAYVLDDDILLLIDIVSGQVLCEVGYLQFQKMQTHMQAEYLRVARTCASNMGVCGTSVVLTLFHRRLCALSGSGTRPTTYLVVARRPQCGCVELSK